MKFFVNAPPAAAVGDGRHTGSLVVAGWLLRIAVLGFAIGIATTIYTRLGSGIGTFLFLEWGIPHATVGQYERIAAAVLLLFSFAALLRPHWAFLAPIAALVILEAAARRFNGGVPFYEWTPWAYALRYAAPLALLVLFWEGLQRRLGARGALITTGWILRIGAAVVFVTHGVEAYLGHPRFVDYLIGTSWNLAGYDLSEEAAMAMMKAIGVVDIVVALLLLAKPHRFVLFWMAFWGLLTALARVTTFGYEVHYEVFLRFSHFLAPLALWLVLRSLERPEPVNTEPKAVASAAPASTDAAS